MYCKYVISVFFSVVCQLIRVHIIKVVDVFLYDVKAYMAWFRSSCSCELIPHVQETLCLSYFPVHHLLALGIQSIAKVSFAILDTHIYSSLAILDAILYFTKQHEICF